MLCTHIICGLFKFWWRMMTVVIMMMMLLLMVVVRKFLRIARAILHITIIYCRYMGVSENRRTPKSSISIRFSIKNHPFWGTRIFGNIHIKVFNCFFHLFRCCGHWLWKSCTLAAISIKLWLLGKKLGGGFLIVHRFSGNSEESTQKDPENNKHWNHLSEYLTKSVFFYVV